MLDKGLSPCEWSPGLDSQRGRAQTQTQTMATVKEEMTDVDETRLVGL